MKRVTMTMLMAALAASIQLSGCGRMAPTPVQAPPAADQTARAPAFFVLDAAASSNVEAASETRESMRARILSQLDLDDTQKAELKNIRAKVKGLFNKEEIKAKWQSMQALLNAPVLDVNAVKAFIASTDAERKARVDSMVALVGEMRDVLTDAQRDKLVSLMAEKPEARAESQAVKTFRTNVVNALNLSTTQQDTLSTLQAKMEVDRDVKHDAMRKAFTQFILDGNQIALADSLKMNIGHSDVDASVQWLGSLSQDQRKILVDKLQELKEKHAALMKQD